MILDRIDRMVHALSIDNGDENTQQIRSVLGNHNEYICSTLQMYRDVICNDINRIVNMPSLRIVGRMFMEFPVTIIKDNSLCNELSVLTQTIELVKDCYICKTTIVNPRDKNDELLTITNNILAELDDDWHPTQAFSRISHVLSRYMDKYHLDDRDDVGYDIVSSLCFHIQGIYSLDRQRNITGV